jgi:hypothetical protein
MPPSSIASMKKNVFKKLDDENIYDELTFDSIEDIYDKLHDASQENENTLLILDDIGASLKDKEIQKILKKIIYNRRHLKVKIVCLVQSYFLAIRSKETVKQHASCSNLQKSNFKTSLMNSLKQKRFSN